MRSTIPWLNKIVIYQGQLLEPHPPNSPRLEGLNSPVVRARIYSEHPAAMHFSLVPI